LRKTEMDRALFGKYVSGGRSSIEAISLLFAYTCRSRASPPASVRDYTYIYIYTHTYIYIYIYIVAVGVHVPQPRQAPCFDQRFKEMCSGSEEGSYLRRIDFCITQL